MTDNFKESLSNQPVIIDNGTGIMKVSEAVWECVSVYIERVECLCMCVCVRERERVCVYVYVYGSD